MRQEGGRGGKNLNLVLRTGCEDAFHRSIRRGDHHASVEEGVQKGVDPANVIEEQKVDRAPRLAVACRSVSGKN